MPHGDSSTSSSDGIGSSSSSSKSSSDGRRPGRRRSRRHSAGSTSSTSSSSDSSSGSDSAGQEPEEEPPSGGISPLSCALLFIMVAVAGGLVIFIVERVQGKSTAGSSASTEPGTIGSTRATSSSRSGTATASAATSLPAATALPTDFLASLASSFTMTPAAISSLAMPSSALPSSSAANAYIADSWHLVKGSGPLSFVEDPLEGGGQVVLEVDYPKGSYSGAKDIPAGVGNMQMAVFGEGKQRAMVSYEVSFSDGFDFVLGGKLPGLFGGDSGSGCTGGKGSEACFSTRFMWREKGAGEVYAYIPTYDGQCGNKSDTSSYQCHGNDGVSIDRGSFVFEAGKWNSITQVAVLNSDPASSSSANGVLAVYVGEERAMYLEDVVFRTNASVLLNAFIFSTFFGGSTENYAASADCSTYYRNMQFFDGDDPSDVQAETVRASVDGG
ncbi:hypothetical protein JCM8208_001192 [Rhodotorula glutinis]